MRGAITLRPTCPFTVCAGSALPVCKRDELNQEWKSFVLVRTIWQEERLHSAREFGNESGNLVAGVSYIVCYVLWM